MAAPTQLGIYNFALRMCKQRVLASLTEATEARRLLDDVWTSNGVQYCLEQGLWYFATRTQQINADPSIAPPFGYTSAFDKPTDWVRTVALALDPYFRVPLTRVRDEAGYWYSDMNPIYVSFVSNDTQYGMNLALWPMTFFEAVGAYFASQVAPHLVTGEDVIARIQKDAKRLMTDARSKAAMNESATFPPLGTWVRARLDRRNSSVDGGSQTELIG